MLVTWDVIVLPKNTSLNTCAGTSIPPLIHYDQKVEAGCSQVLLGPSLGYPLDAVVRSANPEWLGKTGSEGKAGLTTLCLLHEFKVRCPFLFNSTCYVNFFFSRSE